MLSVLDYQPDKGSLINNEGLTTDSVDDISSLKEKLSKYVAYGGKLDSSRFVEFWVPVQISNVQLEQYCATLLSNSLSLCSPLKNDPVGALRDILISMRKVVLTKLFGINHTIAQAYVILLLVFIFLKFFL